MTTAWKYEEKIAKVIEPEKVEVKVGDIFYTSWGYDQTNVEFFQVVRVSKASVWVQETGQERIYSDSSNGDYWKTVSDRKPLVRELRIWEKPGEYEKVTAPITCHRIRYTYSATPAFNIGSYKSAWLWDGKPVNASTGH